MENLQKEPLNCVVLTLCFLCFNSKFLCFNPKFLCFNPKFFYGENYETVAFLVFTISLIISNLPDIGVSSTFSAFAKFHSQKMKRKAILNNKKF